MPSAAPPDRILSAVKLLPLREGMRVLEIGCGPGVAARAVAARIGAGFVLAIDRSDKAVALARRGSVAEIAAGILEFRQVAIEDFVLAPGEARFDLAFAMRVGGLDGRHPKAGEQAMERLRAVIVPEGQLFIDTGDPWDVVKF
jgi:SAM-dependent methyltransferase